MAGRTASRAYLEHRVDEYDSGTIFGNDFRQYVPPKEGHRIDHPRIKGLDKTNVYDYSRDILNIAKAKELFAPWFTLADEPFKGVTVDGHVVEGLYGLGDEGAPTDVMVVAAKAVLGGLSAEEKSKCFHDIDASEWWVPSTSVYTEPQLTETTRRRWSNPEILFNDIGVRLEVLDQFKIDLILKLLEASLSPEGYEKALGAMHTNHFLGELCNANPIMNRYSYHFNLFGQPSRHEPWGFQLFGHHLCIHIFVLEKQMCITPLFIGAEPNAIDEGPWKGTTLLTAETVLGLSLMQSLPAALQTSAQIYRKMHDEAMPPGRWHPADQVGTSQGPKLRHFPSHSDVVASKTPQRQLAGAFRDNRVIPAEGITASSMPERPQAILLELIKAYLSPLPAGPFASRLARIQQHWSSTYFSWIGGYGDSDPYYYRIQSPVILLEFDHHAGVWLLNAEPAKCHTHTVVREPNGGDYGRKVVDKWREEKGLKGGMF
ncbi:hypothetical protein MKZ38_007375 [Zalerion maritima]|uniref:Uncharacterized protein n=1 Tax=Zalerion maritima TaxID=339359 RepID=A0AAD5WPT7_9PEZI|nr:hypothetical protein MKZ38_007375 [Zalerion maritima]